MQTEKTEIIRACDLCKGDKFILNGATRIVKEIRRGRIVYTTGLEKSSIGQFSQQHIERICKPATNFNNHKNK